MPILNVNQFIYEENRISFLKFFDEKTLILKFNFMSEFDNTMSMNSIMDAIHNLHSTQYIVENQNQYMEDFPQFMRNLIKHLQELCLTQTAIDHSHHQLHPFIAEFVSTQFSNPKPAIQGFFREFLKLLSNEIKKINKIGESKLKYLTKTVSKQVFTEIMRMSCDIKFQSINRNNNYRVHHRKRNSVNLFIGTINRIFLEEQLEVFKHMKIGYRSEIQNEDRFVKKLSENIQKLQALGSYKNKSKLSKAMALWRRHATELSHEQILQMSERLKTFSTNMIGGILKAWQNNPKYWHKQLPKHLYAIFHELLGNHHNIGVDFVCSPKFDNLMGSSLDYSPLSSFRSNLSDQSMDSVQQCLCKNEVKYDNQNNMVMIPLSVEQSIGVLVINWHEQFSLVFFQKALKLVQMLKKTLSQAIRISNRLAYHAAEYEENQWQNELYNLYISETEVEIDEIEAILDKIGIVCLQIYHDPNTPRPCISYGSQSAPLFPDNIYHMVWEKLQKSTTFCLERNNLNFKITKLGKGSHQGFCRYLFSQEGHGEGQGSGRSTFVQCIVPLVLSHLGKIGCKTCNIKIKEGLVENILSSDRNKNKVQEICPQNLDINALMLSKQASTVDEVQHCIQQALKELFEGKPMFGKFFYTMNEANNLFMYRGNAEQGIKCLQIPKAVTTENICEYIGNNETKLWTDFVSVLHSNPLFEGASIYLYQKERAKAFKIIPCRIGNKGILVLGSYERLAETRIYESLKLICSQVNGNTNLFVKTDALFWASQIYQSNCNISLPSQQQSQIFKNMLQKPFQELIGEFTNLFGFVQKTYVWKVNAEKGKCLYMKHGQEEDLEKMKNLPFAYLTEEPIQSYQRIPGAHKVIRRSKKCGIKLQQCLSYIPSLSKPSEELSLAKMILQNKDESGQLMDPICRSVTDFLVNSTSFNKDKEQWISIPVPLQKHTYIIVFTFSRNIIINQKSMEALTNLASQTFKKIIAHKKQLSKVLCYRNFISQINPILQETKTKVLKSCITKFNQNCRLEQKKLKILSLAIDKTVQTVNFRYVNQSMGKIKKMSQSVAQKYKKGCQYVIKTINKIFYVRPLIDIAKQMHNKKKGIMKLQNMFEKLQKDEPTVPRWTIAACFANIYQLSLVKQEQIEAKKIIGLKYIARLAENIDYRNKVHIFRKSQECSVSLKKSLNLLKEQFSLIEPQGLRSCLNFLNGRLNLILSQHYAHETQISLHYLHSKPNINEQLEESIKYEMIKNCCFGFIQGSDSISKQIVKPVLQEILPNWQASYRQLMIKKTKALYEKIDKIRDRNLKQIYLIHRSYTNKQNIKSLNDIKKKTHQQKQQMYQLRYSQNTQAYAQSKDAHRRQIKQIRQSIMVLQNQEHKAGIQMRIKSKTNAAYKMISFINRKKHSQKELNANQNNKFTAIEQQIQQIQAEKRIKLCGIWTKNVDRIIRRAQNRAIYEGIWRIAISQIR